MELSANGPQTVGLVTQPFQTLRQTLDVEISIWTVGEQRTVTHLP